MTTKRTLEDEIEAGRLEISADTVSMSISELTNLFREGVLIIRPEFQRLFRWTDDQKSRLIESVLLGIPLPSLFVSQSPDGKWELVDGLQRISTLLQLQGQLLDNSGVRMPPLRLLGTRFLPNLDNHSWTGYEDTIQLSEAQRLDIRLSRLDIKVIKRSSDPKAKFDLFQRLNSFGSVLTAQEVRSAMMASLNSEFLAWVTHLAGRPEFKTCVGLNERQIEEQYDLELVLRFLMLHNLEYPTRSHLADFPAKLDDWVAYLARHFSHSAEPLESAFHQTFAYLSITGDENLFRRWDDQRGSFRGSFLNTSFEVIAMGAGYWISQGVTPRADPIEAARDFSELLSKANRFATGLATADRLVKTLPLGRKLMSDPPAPVSVEDL